MSVAIVRKSPKGAALISDGSVEAWVAPRTAKAVEKGNITPAAKKALANSHATGGSPTGDKVKCHKVSISAIERETDRALLVRDFQGNSDWLPKSCIVGEGATSHSSHLLVKSFALRNKSLVYKSGAVYV